MSGHDPVTQGSIHASESVKSAIARGLIVNTIHCGSEQAGISGGWKNGAMLADGKFLTIDHNRAVVNIEAPQDVKIVKLNAELNQTYLAYDRIGVSKKHDQSVQDKNAAAKPSSGAAVQRAVSKGSSNYHNSRVIIRADWAQSAARLLSLTTKPQVSRLWLLISLIMRVLGG